MLEQWIVGVSWVKNKFKNVHRRSSIKTFKNGHICFVRTRITISVCIKQSLSNDNSELLANSFREIIREYLFSFLFFLIFFAL